MTQRPGLFPFIASPLAALFVGLAVSAAPGSSLLAMDSGGTSTTSTPNCPKGSVWDKKTKKCVVANSGAVTDDVLVEEGRRLAKAGQYENAIAVLQAVSREDPMGLTYLGYSHRKLGEIDRGIAYYKQALAIDPKNADTREYLGEGYVASGRTDLARLELAEVEKLCGTSCEQYGELAAAIEGKATD